MTDLGAGPGDTRFLCEHSTRFPFLILAWLLLLQVSCLLSLLSGTQSEQKGHHSYRYAPILHSGNVNLFPYFSDWLGDFLKMNISFLDNFVFVENASLFLVETG